jgi:hypothetical protein
MLETKINTKVRTKINTKSRSRIADPIRPFLLSQLDLLSTRLDDLDLLRTWGAEDSPEAEMIRVEVRLIRLRLERHGIDGDASIRRGRLIRLVSSINDRSAPDGMIRDLRQ